MAKLRVLLTGATGYIAGQLLPAFRERYDLRLIDTRQEDGSGRPVDGVELVDLLGTSPADLEPVFTGIDVVVHSAYHRPGGSDLHHAYGRTASSWQHRREAGRSPLGHVQGQSSGGPAARAWSVRTTWRRPGSRPEA